MKTLAFLENENQFKTLCKFQKQKSPLEDLIICALTPYALSLCEKEKLPYTLPEWCFSQSRYDEHRTLSEQRLDALIENLNEWSRKEGSAQIGFPLELGNYFHGLLYPLIGSIHYRIAIISEVIQKEKPDRIIGFKLEREPDLYLNFLTHPNGDMYGQIIEQLPTAIPRELLTYSLAPTQRWTERVRKKIRNVEFFYRLRSFFKKQIPFQLIWNNRVHFFSQSQKRVLILGPLYCFQKIVNHPQIKQKIRFEWRMEEHLLKLKNNGAHPSSLLSQIDWDGRYCGVPVTPFILKQMNLMEQEFHYLIRQFEKIKVFLRGIDFVFSSVLLFPSQKFLAHMAGALQKKVVIWIHGEKGLKETLDFDAPADAQYSDFLMTYGDGVTHFFNAWKNPTGKTVKVISIGNSTIDRLVSIEPRKPGYILYATGKYLLSITHMTEILGADTLLYRSQQCLLEYLQKQQHGPVIFKKNPTRHLGDFPPLLANGQGGNKIDCIQFEKKFTDLLPHAEIIILDSPSTACIESVATKIPLFVIMNRFQYSPEPLRLLKKRSVVVGQPQDLIEKIDAYFQRGIYAANVNNNEFAKAYASHLHDGLSAQRAVNFFQKLCA